MFNRQEKPDKQLPKALRIISNIIKWILFAVVCLVLLYIVYMGVLFYSMRDKVRDITDEIPQLTDKTYVSDRPFYLEWYDGEGIFLTLGEHINKKPDSIEEYYKHPMAYPEIKGMIPAGSPFRITALTVTEKAWAGTYYDFAIRFTAGVAADQEFKQVSPDSLVEWDQPGDPPSKWTLEPFVHPSP